MTADFKLKKLKSYFWLFTIVFIVNNARTTFTAPAEDFSDLLSLAPPNKEATIEYTDSYGNPIQTADGKKVLNAKEPLAVAEEPVTSLPEDIKDPLASVKSYEIEKIAESSQIVSRSIFDETKVPEWIAAFNDPNVGPAQPYIPDFNAGLSVITWGLVPPEESHDYLASSSEINGKPDIKKQTTDEIPTYPTVTTTPTTTTTITIKTTPRPASTTKLGRATTTKSPTRSYTTTQKTRTTPYSNNKETDIFSLENHIEGQIPEWLADYNDTDLASGVPYKIPADLNEVKNTVTLGLIAPLAPFADIAPLKLPPHLLSTTFTTKRPISSTFSILPKSTISIKNTKQPTTTSTASPTTSTTATEPSLITASEENVFKQTLPPWLANFDDPDVGPGVPYVFKEENEDQVENSKGIIESSSNIHDVVISSPSTPILFSTAISPVNTFLSPTTVRNGGHLASNSVFPSTATTTSTYFKKESQANFQSRTLNNQSQNRNSIPTSSPSPFKIGSFPSITPSTVTTKSSSFAPNQIPNSTKFSGRFGGAPGILGDQTTPGFGVKPSAFSKATTVSSPDTSISASSGLFERRVSNSDRYTGGFGGPPGILSPYDNIRNSA